MIGKRREHIKIYTISGIPYIDNISQFLQDKSLRSSCEKLPIEAPNLISFILTRNALLVVEITETILAALPLEN